MLWHCIFTPFSVHSFVQTRIYVTCVISSSVAVNSSLGMNVSFITCRGFAFPPFRGIKLDRFSVAELILALFCFRVVLFLFSMQYGADAICKAELWAHFKHCTNLKQHQGASSKSFVVCEKQEAKIPGRQEEHRNWGTNTGMSLAVPVLPICPGEVMV